jgi:hypothetical protein
VGLCGREPSNPDESPKQTHRWETLMLNTDFPIDDGSWFFEMGCDAAAECFRPLDGQSLDQLRAVRREHDRIVTEVFRPIETKLETVPAEHLRSAVGATIFGILTNFVSLLHEDRRQLAQREPNAAASCLPADAADSAADATGR